MVGLEVVRFMPPSVTQFDPDVIRKLKDETEGLIYVSGSGTLVRALLRERLVDELHLFVYPVAVGRGKRRAGDDVDPTRLALTEHDVYENGVVHLAYSPA